MVSEPEKHLCIYCQQEAHYQFKNGKWCCSKNHINCPVVKTRQKESLHTHADIGVQIQHKSLNLPYICAYCGSAANYQLKNRKWCCQPSSTACPTLRKKNSESIQHLYQIGQLDQQKNIRNRTKESFQRQGWSKGKTKFTDERLKARGEKMMQLYREGKITPSWIGKKHTPEEIDKIVYGMSHFQCKKNTKGFKRGWYKGFWCDSSWELAFVMFNLDHQIKFERNHQGFKYFYNNVWKRFYPDFILNGQYIEIKGYLNDMTKAKIDCFPKDLTLKILVKKDMQKYIDYAYQTYGFNFWTLLTDKEN